MLLSLQILVIVGIIVVTLLQINGYRNLAVVAKNWPLETLKDQTELDDFKAKIKPIRNNLVIRTLVGIAIIIWIASSYIF